MHFRSEIKAGVEAEKERWVAVSPMKLHGKNILKCISNNVAMLS